MLGADEHHADVCGAGADVLFAGQSYQEPAANVAEYHDIPLVTLHHIPMRPNGQLVTILPSRLGRAAMRAFDWVSWRLNKKVEDAQRRELRLPKASSPSPQRIAERRSLEIQGMTRSVSRVWLPNGRSGMDCGHSWAR